MVMYTCDKCGYTTNRKGNYISHLNRKIPCVSKDVNIVCSLKNPPKPSKILQNSLQNPQKSLQNPPIINDNDSDLECIYCGKVFKRKDNLTRHISHRCKIIKSQMNELELEKSKWEDEKLELKTKTSELENKVEKLSQDLINKPQNIITQNNINNGKISNKTININSYGNESIDHLTNSYLKDLIGLPYTAVQKLIKDIHCNPKVPENHNLRKRNKKDKYIEYYDGKQWKIEDKRKQLDHLVDMTFTILENIVDGEDDIDNKHLERFSNFRDKYYENRDNIKTNDINDAEIMIINNTK